MNGCSSEEGPAFVKNDIDKGFDNLNRESRRSQLVRHKFREDLPSQKIGGLLPFTLRAPFTQQFNTIFVALGLQFKRLNQ